jgi:hypothetical protein
MLQTRFYKARTLRKELHRLSTPEITRPSAA